MKKSMKSMKVNRVCPMCGAEHTITVREDEYNPFASLIQDQYPSYNPMEREFLKSGYCPKCQSMLFGSDYKSKRIK